MQPCHNSELASLGEKKWRIYEKKNLITKINSQLLQLCYNSFLWLIINSRKKMVSQCKSEKQLITICHVRKLWNEIEENDYKRIEMNGMEYI